MTIAIEIYIQFLSHLEYVIYICQYFLLLNVQRIQILELFSLTRVEKCSIRLRVMWFCLCRYFTIQISGISHSSGDSSSAFLKYRSCNMIEMISWNIKKQKTNKTPLLLHLLVETNIYFISFYINTGIFIFLQTIPYVSPNRCSNKILKLIGLTILWVLKEKQNKARQNKN